MKAQMPCCCRARCSGTPRASAVTSPTSRGGGRSSSSGGIRPQLPRGPSRCRLGPILQTISLEVMMVCSQSINRDVVSRALSSILTFQQKPPDHVRFLTTAVQQSVVTQVQGAVRCCSDGLLMKRCCSKISHCCGVTRAAAAAFFLFESPATLCRHGSDLGSVLTAEPCALRHDLVSHACDRRPMAPPAARPPGMTATGRKGAPATMMRRTWTPMSRRQTAVNSSSPQHSGSRLSLTTMGSSWSSAQAADDGAGLPEMQPDHAAFPCWLLAVYVRAQQLPWSARGGRYTDNYLMLCWCI